MRPWWVMLGQANVTFLEGEMFRRLLEAFLLPQGSLLQRHAMKIEEILANFQM